MLLNYFKETLSEAKKLYFPNKKEVYITTITIVVTIAIFALAVTIADFFISKIISLVFGL